MRLKFQTWLGLLIHTIPLKNLGKPLKRTMIIYRDADFNMAGSSVPYLGRFGDDPS